MPLASAVLSSINLITVTRARLQDAGFLQPPLLRTLDAIHVASALALGPRLGAVITYDRRMSAAAQWYGIRVLNPA